MNKILALGIGIFTCLISDIKFDASKPNRCWLTIAVQDLSGKKAIIAVDLIEEKNFWFHVNLNRITAGSNNRYNQTQKSAGYH